MHPAQINISIYFKSCVRPVDEYQSSIHSFSGHFLQIGHFFSFLFLATWGQCKEVLMTSLTYYLLRCYGELRNSCFHIQQTLRNSNAHLEYYFFVHLINLSQAIALLLALFWSPPTPEKYIQLLKTLLCSPASQYLPAH